MSKYLDIIYDQKLRPITSYPDTFATYFFKRFAMQKADRFLDLGCGRGEFTRSFEKLGLVVEGADLEIPGPEVVGDMKVKHFDFETDSYPYPDNHFDFVFSKSVMEHIGNPKHSLNEQRRILKPGGRIIILTPDWVSQMKIFWNDHTHKRPYTVLGMKNTLTILEYKNVEAELFYQYPPYWKHPFLKIIAKIFQLAGPVRKLYKNKLYRWSRELMILGTGTK